MATGFPSSEVLVPSRVSMRSYGAIAVASIVVAGALLGLFGRIVNYTVRHDEQVYMSVGVLFGKGDIYRDFGFNNLPNLPILLNAIYTVFASNHLLLTGRLVVFAGWLVASFAIAGFAWRAARSGWAAVLAPLLLLTNPTLLGQAGMLVSNNFLPIPFAILGTWLFVSALDTQAPRRGRLFAAGICVAVAAGFKANYIFLVPPLAFASVLLPRSLAPVKRLTSVTLWFGLGGLVGAMPTLIYFVADPDNFLAHVIRYHRGPHITYWLENSDLDGAKVMDLRGKILIAARVWAGEATALILAVAIYLLWAGRDTPTEQSRSVRWPIVLVLALMIGSMIVSFIPTPAFPQYYTAPIPFFILLVALLFGALSERRRTTLGPWIAAVLAVPIVAGSPRLLMALPAIATPDEWVTTRVHAAGVTIADAVRTSGASGPVATLAPIYALEGGMDVYPELATGPIVYRVGDLIPAADRKHYNRLVSPTTISATLDRQPPAAILVGVEGALDDPLIAYARQHAYRLDPNTIWSDRYGRARLLVRQPRG